MKTRNLSAFTLSELLVVLVIVGILIAIAIPSFMPLISKARSLEAKKQLKHVHSLQKVYFYEYSSFSDDLMKIDFEQSKSIDGTDENNYSIEMVSATNTTFLARATANKDFDQDGILNVWEINQDGQLTETVKD
ncbi:MAG: type II secretion system protein [Cyclobacteriaceae bacterium]